MPLFVGIFEYKYLCIVGVCENSLTCNSAENQNFIVGTTRTSIPTSLPVLYGTRKLVGCRKHLKIEEALKTH